MEWQNSIDTENDNLSDSKVQEYTAPKPTGSEKLVNPPTEELSSDEDVSKLNAMIVSEATEADKDASMEAAGQQETEIEQEDSIKYIFDTLNLIDEITAETEALRKQIENFSGSSTDDKEYVFLEEMLIRATVNLDNIDTRGHLLIKKERKGAVQYVQRLMKILDSRLKENKRNIRYYNNDSDDDF